MRSRELEFSRMDAGERREFLAAELAEWIEVGFWDFHRAEIFRRRVRRLARSIDAMHDEVMADLRADAEAILAERGTTGARS